MGFRKMVPKVILEGTRLTHKTDLAFALNEHPRVVGPRKYRYHSPVISGEWCGFTNTPWGRGLINFEPDEEAKALETYDTWVRLFELQRYYDHPEEHRGTMESHLPHLSVLVNGIFWTPAYPRVVAKDSLRRLAQQEQGGDRLIAIGDIGCDIDGAVEMTVKATSPGSPIYVYDPVADTVTDGARGPGVAMMTTDCLPCELSKDASEHFTAALAPFAEAIARASYSGPTVDESLPEPIRRAVILWRGELTPAYEHLRRHLG